MENEPVRRVARLDRNELYDLPAQEPAAERGRLLRRLLEARGIDPERLFLIDYYPHHHCWIVSQEEKPAAPVRPAEDPHADEVFYWRTIAEFRRVARTACAALAAHSAHFARFGCKYHLPEPPKELSLNELVDLLGGAREGAPPVHFDSEGRWRTEPRDN